MASDNSGMDGDNPPPAPKPGLRLARRRAARGSRVARVLPPALLTPKVLDAIGDMSARIEDLARRLAEAETRSGTLAELADRDPLLDIFNRRAFERELSRTAAYARRYNAKASLVFIDLNKFKWINDVYGHKAGDAVLVHVASIIRANIRRSDIVGRLGGDEFGVILAQVSGELALRKAERLEAMIATTPIEVEGPGDVGGVTLLLTASAGAADITGEGSLAEIMERADKAMYKRKEIYHSGDPR